MALSLSNFLVTLLLLLPHGLLTAVRGETVILDWQIGWTTANPDGLFERQVIGINGQWPLPFLNFTRGDRVVVNMHNQLNESSSLHFHGLFQKGTNHFDGPPGVTQCDIPPGSTVQYNFSLDQSGTYWYHSHSQAQYPDGLRQQFIITDPDSPYRDQYDDERAFTLSDWYHDGMNTLVAQYINYTNPTGVEPVPKSVLMNDTQNLTVSVQPGKTYLFRLSNVGAFAGQYFWIEGHRMKIIEVDGVYTEPKETDMIYISAAQRYGFLVTARNDSSANFAMVGSMDTELFDKVPATLNYNVTGWLVYDDTAPKPGARPVDEYTPLDDMTLVPYDKLELYDDVDHTINLDVTMGNLGDGANYAFFNNVTYVSPVVPTLYSALTTGGNASDVAVYGSYTNSFVLQKDEVVEIVLYNNDIGKHPFHLHGHNFQAVVRSDKGAGPYDPYNHPAFATVPMRRDTFMVQPRGNFVLRFKADNPGVWFFHCHIYWHLAAGLSATLIEAPLELQKMLSIPGDFIAACRAGGAAVAGNAAGNTVNVLDLTGENKSVPPLPAGFTARGIVALVLSCLSAIIGMAVIAWYGAAPLSSAELAATQRFIAKAGGSAT